jgi:hypothetical protein
MTQDLLGSCGFHLNNSCCSISGLQKCSVTHGRQSGVTCFNRVMHPLKQWQSYALVPEAWFVDIEDRRCAGLQHQSVTVGT